MDLFNQLTVGLKEQQQLKVEFVESLTELQLLQEKEVVVVSKRPSHWDRFVFLSYYFKLYQVIYFQFCIWWIINSHLTTVELLINRHIGF